MVERLNNCESKINEDHLCPSGALGCSQRLEFPESEIGNEEIWCSELNELQYGLFSCEENPTIGNSEKIICLHASTVLVPAQETIGRSDCF